MRKHSFSLLISHEDILQKIAEMGNLIDKDYAGKEIAIVFVLKGALCVVADLIRHIKTLNTIDFVQASSYGARGKERGELQIIGLDKLDLASKDVLLVDDILDSGETLSQIHSAILNKHPKSIKTLVLLSKRIPRSSSFVPEYVLFEIEDHFVVGYGLDYKELYRGLPGIYTLEGT